MTDQHSDQYILFTVAATAYALPSSQIAHVDLVETITRVPNAAPFVDGVVFSRGQIVPAIQRGIRATQEGRPVLLEFITSQEIEYSVFSPATH